jgi:hypothetical protein
VGGQLHVSTVLALVKETLLRIGWEAEWATELAWTLWRKEKSLVPAEN